MPHLRFRAIENEILEQLSLTLAKDLAEEIQTSIDNFTFENIQSQFYSNGERIKSYPFVEIYWFKRTKEIQDNCAQIITSKMKALTDAEDVVVVFHELEKSNYYENGNHF